ncbi:MAG: hypothetical protein ACR2OZ_16330 [Verrucomicrobiales bacterium]
MNIFRFLVAAFVAPGALSGAITISGLSDRQVAADSITFTVNGATSATVDGAAVALGQPVTIDATGYHELVATDGADTQTRQFIVRASERISTEVGLPKMVPYHFVNDAPSAFAAGVLTLMAPGQFPKDLPIPVAARLTKDGSFGADAGDPLWLNGVVRASQFPTSALQLRRGWGSTILPSQGSAGNLTCDAFVNGLSAPRPIVIEPSTTWTNKGGTMSSADDWGSNARISLGSNLTVAAGGSLTIGAGTVIRCSQGVEIWVAPGGSVQINGTVEAPVVFVPDNAAQLWGGVWLQAASGTSIAQFTAAGTIFCRWGANPNWLAQAPHNSFSYHKAFEPCFAVSRGAELQLTDCALVGPIGLADQRGAAFASDDGATFSSRALSRSDALQVASWSAVPLTSTRVPLSK